MSGLDRHDLREIAVQAAWGAAFATSFLAHVERIRETLATERAGAVADAVADCARNALERVAAKDPEA